MQAIPRAAKRHCFALAATLSLFLNPGWAQVATPSTPTESKPDTAVPASAQDNAAAASKGADNQETVVLSPFVVDVSKDEGYQASSTLAGSRINTDLKDVPQSDHGPDQGLHAGHGCGWN